MRHISSIFRPAATNHRWRSAEAWPCQVAAFRHERIHSGSMGFQGDLFGGLATLALPIQLVP